MTKGYIPKSVTIVYRNETKTIKCRYVGIDWREEVEPYATHDVIPCFVVDSENNNTLKTAVSWAQRGLYNNKKVLSKTQLNEPITKLQIIELIHRGEGGRAYKVKTEEGFYFDLREDQLMDAIIQTGINKDGILPGEYVFACCGETKLVRVGSYIYNKLTENTDRRTKANFKEKDLQVSGVYKNKVGNIFVYFGKVSTLDLGYEVDYGGSYYYNTRNNHTITYKKKERKNKGLWFEVHSMTLEKIQKEVDKLRTEKGVKESFYSFNFRDKVSVCELMGTINIPTLKEISDFALSSISSCVKEYEKCSVSQLVHLVKAGEQIPRFDEYKEIYLKVGL